MQILTNKVSFIINQIIRFTKCKGSFNHPFGTGMSIGMAIRGATNYHKIDFP